VRAWHSGKRERDQSRGGSSTSNSGKSAAEVMQPQAKRSTAWGQQPAGGWTASQTKAWEKEQQESKEVSEDMDEGVQKAVQELRRDPAAVSKKTEEAIKSTGVRPDKKLVARLAAHRWWHTAWRAGRPTKTPQLESCVTRRCRWRCALWWGITKLSTKGAGAPAEAMGSAPCIGSPQGGPARSTE
jgi:hypothetical protein